MKRSWLNKCKLLTTVRENIWLFHFNTESEVQGRVHRNVKWEVNCHSGWVIDKEHPTTELKATPLTVDKSKRFSQVDYNSFLLINWPSHGYKLDDNTVSLKCPFSFRSSCRTFFPSPFTQSDEGGQMYSPQDTATTLPRALTSSDDNHMLLYWICMAAGRGSTREIQCSVVNILKESERWRLPLP